MIDNLFTINCYYSLQNYEKKCKNANIFLINVIDMQSLYTSFLNFVLASSLAIILPQA